MSALHDALRHPANRPGPLVRWLAAQVNPAAELRGLEDGGGVFCDFRPGLEERDPSLSASVGSAGAVFKRFGGDEFEGGAADFTAACLGVPTREAARLLIDRAGIVDTPLSRGPQMTVRGRPTAKAEAGAARLLSKLDKLKPLEDQAARDRLRGWVKLEAGEGSPEAGELARRGLLPVLASGVLVAYRFAGRDGEGKRVSLPGHVQPGAVAFEIRGPDGAVWALKVRNPGSKEDLEAVKAQRYVYLGKGQGTPAWCSPGAADAVAHVITEGELNGAAVALALEAAGYGVQGVASAEALPHVAHLRPGAEIYLYGDGDAAGDKARQTWAGLLHSQGAKVYQLPADLFGGGDACEALPGMTPGELGVKIGDAMKAAPLWTPPRAEAEDGPPAEGQGQDGDVWVSKREGFGVRRGVLCALSMKREEGTQRNYEVAEELCNFAAFITAEVIEEDGTGETPRLFEVEGRRADGRLMGPGRVKVAAPDFAGMGWPVREWGARAIVRNGTGKKDKAREAIQRLSEKRGFPERTVYTHTGWIQHKEHGPLYLTAGAVIGARGAVEGVTVDLGAGLNAYALPDPGDGEGEELRDAVRASLALLELAPDPVGVPALGAAYRAVLGRVDFAVWKTGETGRNKTTFAALVTAHYGAGWNRQHLPEGWNSTANALEKTAHMVKDALLPIDDFKPGGSQTDVQRAHGNLARILQGVGDGAGRGRMGMDRKRQAGMYPRGLVMSSSETLPRGHSNRARVMVVEVARKLIDSPAKSRAYYEAAGQGKAGVYALALAGFVRFIAAHHHGVMVDSPIHNAFTRELAPRFEGAHGRTGPAAAELAYGWAAFLTFAEQIGAIGGAEALAYWGRVVAALESTAKDQGAHLRDADPVDTALSLLSSLLAQGRVFLEDLEDGAPPEDVAPSLGWQARPWEMPNGASGVHLTTRPTGLLIGYYSKSGGDEWAYFLPNALHEALQKAVSGQAGAVLPDQSTLYGNMKDRFHPALMRCEVEHGGEGKAGRVRPYYKCTVRGTRDRFVALRLPLNPDTYKLGTVGTMGTDGEERTSGTASGPVPSYKLFRDDLGTIGTPSSKELPSFAGSPILLGLEYAEEIDGVMTV